MTNGYKDALCPVMTVIIKTFHCTVYGHKIAYCTSSVPVGKTKGLAPSVFQGND